jgi:hypothetical protein
MLGAFDYFPLARVITAADAMPLANQSQELSGTPYSPYESPITIYKYERVNCAANL